MKNTLISRNTEELSLGYQDRAGRRRAKAKARQLRGEKPEPWDRNFSRHSSEPACKAELGRHFPQIARKGIAGSHKYLRSVHLSFIFQ